MSQHDRHKWFGQLFVIKGSILSEIKGRVLLCTAWSAVLIEIDAHVIPVGFNSVVHSLVGLALGMLLVFRTNASYDRFWEARKLWGAMSGETRNLVRSSEAFLENAPELRREVAQWAIVFVFAVKSFLKKKRDIGPMSPHLDPELARQALEATHPALFAARQIGLTLQKARNQGHISEYVQVHLDQSMQRLLQNLGGCERIKRTPVPFAYVIHLRRALVFYCFTLPFALLDAFTYKWSMVFGTLFLSYVFFGVEEIGVEMEDPFGDDESDLDLDTFCASIERNVKGLSTVDLNLTSSLH